MIYVIRSLSSLKCETLKIELEFEYTECLCIYTLLKKMYEFATAFSLLITCGILNFRYSKKPACLLALKLK
jgi:hypothetical protein